MSGPAWLAFLLAALVISLSPGPGAVASMASGSRWGFPGGYWTAIGLQGGLLAQFFLAAVGAGAILAASPSAFAVVRIGGALYLAGLGLRLLLSAQGSAAVPCFSSDKTSGQLRRGFLVNLSNPKAIVFLFAILPQFVDLRHPLGWQYVTMAATMVAVDLAVMAGYTALGATFLAWFSSPRHRVMLDRIFGALFLVASVALAFHHR